MGRSCNICSVVLEEFDPHLRCKMCRQPDPNLFYCTNQECKACSAIQSYKPLDYFLRKKCEVLSNKSTPLSLKDEPECTAANEKGNRSSLISNQLVNNIGGQLKKQTTNTAGEEALLENRLYHRILSSVLTSFKDHEQKNLSEDMFDVHKELLSQSVFKYNNDVAKISSQLAPLMDTYNDHDSHKLSSGCGEILLRNSLLSNPSTAETLAKQIDISEEDEFWPIDIDPSFILKLCSDIPITLKFHPKARQFQTIIFGEFNPKLPNDVITKNYCLRPISHDIKITFLHSRQKLRNLLFLYSLMEALLATDIASLGNHLGDLLLIIRNHLESVLIREVNCFSIILQNVRKFLLSEASCKVEGAIDKLVCGPAHPTQFFGPFVCILQNIIKEKGSDYCIMYKRMPVLKVKRLPKTQLPFNFLLWKKLFNEFIESHDITPDDKFTVAMFLLPETIKSMLRNVGNDLDYEQLISILENNLHTSEELMRKKQFYARVQSANESVSSFAEDLKRRVPSQLSAEIQEKMLRDQFLCGIYDEETRKKLCEQICLTFGDCVNYVVIGPKTSDNNTVEISRKRKRSTSSSDDVCYKTSKASNKLLSTDMDKWMECLNLNNMESYDVICPWTGMKLRGIKTCHLINV